MLAATVALVALLPGCASQGGEAGPSSAETTAAQSSENVAPGDEEDHGALSSTRDGADSPAGTLDGLESAGGAGEGAAGVAPDAAAMVRLTVSDRAFAVELADTPAARDFATRLPLSLAFDELNGNEKFTYLDAPLSTQPSNPGTIHQGDVMLFGDNCLVVFYDTFSTNYQYTRIGRIADADGLAAAVGKSQAEMTFEAI